jgi:hypothetical protein
MVMFNNPQRKVATTWWSVTVVAALVAAAPLVVPMPQNGLGNLLCILSGCLAVAGVFVAWTYHRHAAALDRLVSGEGLLAHWAYNVDEWQRYLADEGASETAANAGLFWTIGGIALVVGVIFLLVAGEGGGVVLLIMLGLVVIIGATAILATRAGRRRRAAAAPDAFVGSNGVFVAGRFHSWNFLTSRLDKASLKEQKTPALVLTYSYATKTGRTSTTVRVPIPDGKAEEARRVIEQLEVGGRPRR